MDADHRSFFEQPEGAAIKAVLTRPDLLPQYELLSRIDVPAVQAAVWDLDPLLERLDEPSRQLAIATPAQVVFIHDRQLAAFGRLAGLRDEGALESALGRPQNRWLHESAELHELGPATPSASPGTTRSPTATSESPSCPRPPSCSSIMLPSTGPG